jgi:CDP-diacylglycerol--inositol 3-phosphatidyltransferase
VPLWWPNIVGYSRVVLAFAAYGFAAARWDVCFFCLYLGSQFLDVVDGALARRLHQCSTFGAVLDMVIDRTSNACMCILIASVAAHLTPLLCALSTLDVASHWFAVVATSVQRGRSHKKMSTHWLLQLYYRPAVLFAVVLGNESWFVLSYLAEANAGAADSATTALVRVALTLCTPVMLARQAINVVQLVQAADCLARVDSPTPASPSTSEREKVA